MTLPPTWLEIRDARTGDLLFWRQANTGHEVWPEYGRYRAMLDGEPLLPGANASLMDAIGTCEAHAEQQQRPR